MSLNNINSLFLTLYTRLNKRIDGIVAFKPYELSPVVKKGDETGVNQTEKSMDSFFISDTNYSEDLNFLSWLESNLKIIEEATVHLLSENGNLYENLQHTLWKYCPTIDKLYDTTCVPNDDLGNELSQGAYGSVRIDKASHGSVIKLVPKTHEFATYVKLRDEIMALKDLSSNHNIIDFMGANNYEAHVGLRFPNYDLDLFTMMQKPPEVNCAYIIYQVLEGLRHMHSVGYAHADIKPENIMVNVKTQHTVLIDFGLSTQKQTGTKLVGSPPYLSPEMFGGRWIPYDCKKSDIYSFGLMSLEIQAWLCDQLEDFDRNWIEREWPQYTYAQTCKFIKGSIHKYEAMYRDKLFYKTFVSKSLVLDANLRTFPRLDIRRIQANVRRFLTKKYSKCERKGASPFVVSRKRLVDVRSTEVTINICTDVSVSDIFASIDRWKGLFSDLNAKIHVLYHKLAISLVCTGLIIRTNELIEHINSLDWVVDTDTKNIRQRTISGWECSLTDSLVYERKIIKDGQVLDSRGKFIATTGDYFELGMPTFGSGPITYARRRSVQHVDTTDFYRQVYGHRLKLKKDGSVIISEVKDTMDNECRRRPSPTKSDNTGRHKSDTGNNCIQRPDNIQTFDESHIKFNDIVERRQSTLTRFIGESDAMNAQEELEKMVSELRDLVIHGK